MNNVARSFSRQSLTPCVLPFFKRKTRDAFPCRRSSKVVETFLTQIAFVHQVRNVPLAIDTQPLAHNLHRAVRGLG